MSMPKRVYQRAYATVRFMSKDLDPLLITLALRLPPDHTHRDGEPRLIRTKNGRVEERSPWHGGMWSMCSEKLVDSPRLETHLEWLLGELKPRAEAIATIRQAGIEIDIFCYSTGANQEPPSLPSAIRQRIQALGIKLDIDHYYLKESEQT